MKIPFRKKQLVKLDNSGSSAAAMATTIAPITITIPANNINAQTVITDKYNSDEMELKNFSDELQKVLEDANNGVSIILSPASTSTNGYEIESTTFENLAQANMMISATTNQPKLMASEPGTSAEIFEDIDGLNTVQTATVLPIMTTPPTTIPNELPVNETLPAVIEHDLRQKEQLLDAIDHFKSIEDETNAANEESIELEPSSTINSVESFEIVDSQLLSKEKSATFHHRPLTINITTTEQSSFDESSSTPTPNAEHRPQSLPTPSTSTINSSLASLSSEKGTTKMIIRKNGNRTVRKVVFIRNPISAVATGPAAAAIAAVAKKTYRKRAVGDENHIHTGPITPSPLLPIAPPPAHSPIGLSPLMPYRAIGQRLNEESSVERGERRKQNLEKLMQFVTMCGHVDRYINTRLRSSVKKLGKLFDTEEEEETRRRRRRRFSFV